LNEQPATLRIEIDLAMDPGEAFARVVEEIRFGLDRRGLRFSAGPDGGLLERGRPVARVVEWEAGRKAVVDWHPESWNPETSTRLEIRAEPVAPGARVTIEQRGWEVVVGGSEELTGWFGGELAARFLFAMAPGAVGDWLTDRQARRPTGPQSAEVYRDPLYHYPGFHVLLDELDLRPGDRLLEVACGGGAFMRMALESGCRAAAIDFSPEMVRVARDLNREAIAHGRLEIARADAAALPFADETFTCATMAGALGFLEDPVAALTEIRRVLAPGGRAVIMGTDPELRGTPAAPEPMASRLTFYDEEGLEELGRAAGFAGVSAVRRSLDEHARTVGIPEEHLVLFDSVPSRFLLLRKDA